MFELIGNMHMHTPYSDGTKLHAEIAEEAIKAGLDFIIVTDHNIWVDGVEGYYQNDIGRVLLLVGEEVHDVRRSPQANHFLAYGAERELSRFGHDPQRLIDETREAGGCGFLAHPFDPAAPKFNEGSLGWQDWDVNGYTGIEIWNFMSNFKGHISSLSKTIRAALNPERYIIGPEVETLAKWDDLLALGQRVTAVGNSDAHGLRYGVGPISRIVFPYEFLFKAVNTHLLIANELNGDVLHDKSLILRAIGKGNSWIGYDMPAATRGFRFSGQAQTKGIMGDDIELEAGATLQIRTPDKCNIRLIYKGKVIAEAHEETNLTHIPTEPGAYRVECSISFLGRNRGWIFSNPIYLC